MTPFEFFFITRRSRPCAAAPPSRFLNTLQGAWIKPPDGTAVHVYAAQRTNFVPFHPVKWSAEALLQHAIMPKVSHNTSLDLL